MKKIYFIFIGVLILGNVNAQLDTIATFNSTIEDLKVFDGKLFIGGSFTRHNDTTCYWSAYYDGVNFTRQLNTIGGSGVKKFEVFEDNLYNAGSMIFMPWGGVGIWTEFGWNPSAPSNSSNSEIYAHGNELFTSSDQGVIKSKTAGTWVVFYDFNGNGNVYAMMGYENDLYFGGSFSEVDGMPFSNIAKWDGSSWFSVDSGVNGNVFEMAVYNGELYVSGSFSVAGGVSVNNFAKWDGTSWSDVGEGLSAGGVIRAMKVHDGRLYVTGSFNEIGGSTANNFAFWDGSSWTGINYTHPEFSINSIEVYNNEIYLGGYQLSGDCRLYRVGEELSTTENAISPNISIYPNPSAGIFNIKIDNNQTEIAFRVLNTSGQVVMQGEGSEFDISEHKDGVYFVEVNVKGKTEVMKVMKK